MTELDRAPTLIVQNGADTLLSQLTQGRLTPDEYHQAVALVTPLQEEGRRCLYCSASATIGTTCADHADKSAIRKAARAACPIVNLAQYSTLISLTGAVIAALERCGREEAARQFERRAAEAHGMNGLCQIARDYIRLETRIV